MFNFKRKKVKIKNHKLASLMLNIGSLIKAKSDHYCDYYTTNGRHTIMMTDHSLMSIIRIHGLKSSLSNEEYLHLLTFLAQELNFYFSKTGYQISFIYRHDDGTDNSIDYIHNKKVNQAKMFGIDIEDIIAEDTIITKGKVYNEELILVVQTFQGAIEPSELELEALSLKETMPVVMDKQNPFLYRDVMQQKHDGFLDKINNTLDKAGVISYELMNVVTALQEVKKFINPDTPPKWTPSVVLPINELTEKEQEKFAGYRLHFAKPMTADPRDLGHMLPIGLAEQIVDDKLREVVSPYAPQQTIAYGDKLFTSILVRELPNMPADFGEFFNSLNSFTVDIDGKQRLMPYSFCMTLGSNGSPKFAMKRTLGSFLRVIPSPNNAKTFDALTAMLHLNEVEKLAMVSIQMSFMTWADNTRAGETRLRIQKTKLTSAVENWGGIKVDRNIGDNMLAWADNLPIRTHKVASVGLLPLVRGLEFAPLRRPASMFKNPSLFYCTTDGKLVAKEVFSPQQNAHFSIIVGGSGRGKSVLANDMLLEHIIAPNQTSMPLVHVIDNGQSARGLIETIKASMPRQLQHLVDFRQLKNDSENSDSYINPFDIIGVKPNPDEQRSIVDFLSTITRLSSDRTAHALFISLIEVVYKQLADNDRKAFNRSHNEELTRLLFDLEVIHKNPNIVGEHYNDRGDKVIYWDEQELTYSDIEDICHDRAMNLTAYGDHILLKKAEYIRARDLAHRYSMPILPDFINYLTSEQITNAFRGKKLTGSDNDVIDEVRIALMSAIQEYPIFASYTKFEAQESKILAVDIKEVIIQGDDRNNSLMLQVALMLGTKKFMISEEFAYYCKPNLRADFIKRSKEMLQTKKILFIDEFHTGAKDEGFMSAIDYGGATWRKYAISTTLASQYLHHYIHDKSGINLLKYCTHLYCMEEPTNNGSNNNRTIFQEQFGVPDSLAEGLGKHMGLSPNHGSIFFNVIRMADGSNFFAFLARKIGAKRLWAVSSTPRERSLRMEVYRQCRDYRKTINALAYFFGSSIGTYMDDRLSAIENTDMSDLEKAELSKTLFEDVAKEVIQAYDAHLIAERAEKERREREALIIGNDIDDEDMLDDEDILDYISKQEEQAIQDKADDDYALEQRNNELDEANVNKDLA